MHVIGEEHTPEGTLKAMLERAEHFDGVIVLALNKDSSQFMMSSHMSAMEKSFLVAFAQAWVMKWFAHENG